MDVTNKLYDNLPDDIKELIAVGIYTEEEAIEKYYESFPWELPIEE